MSSANVVYGNYFSQKYLDILSGELAKKGYKIADYLFVGNDTEHSNNTVISICPTDNDQDMSAKSVLEKIAEESKAIVEGINRTIDDPIAKLSEYMFKKDNFKVIGEYSDPKAASEIFSALALGYVIKRTKEELGDLVETLNRVGRKLQTI